MSWDEQVRQDHIAKDTEHPPPPGWAWSLGYRCNPAGDVRAPDLDQLVAVPSIAMMGNSTNTHALRDTLLAAILHDRGGNIQINSTSLNWATKISEAGMPYGFTTTTSPDNTATVISLGIPSATDDITNTERKPTP